MGLDELISDNTEEEKTKKKSKNTGSRSKNYSGQKTIKRTDDIVEDPGPDNVTVAGDDSPLSPLQCKECQSAMAVPVKGLARDEEGRPTYGALMRCTRVFCERSIFNEEDPPIEFDRMEVFKEMNEKVSKDERITGW